MKQNDLRGPALSSRLNYNHLRYFWVVAREGHLSRAAAQLNLSQSALSTQIKKLEDQLGHPLFARRGRGLALTEAGRIALDHADRIFGAGRELIATLQRAEAMRPPLRVGAISTLSRNFQLRFLRPLLAGGEADLVLRSGGAPELFAALTALALDVVLTTDPPPAELAGAFVAHRIAEQPVALHGAPHRLRHASLRALLENEPLILPTQSSIRTGFQALVARLGATPRIAAEVDDMAMVRLLAREDAGLAMAPSVVLADEIAAGLLITTPFDLAIVESFYAVTIRRSFPHPRLAELLGREGAAGAAPEDPAPDA